MSANYSNATMRRPYLIALSAATTEQSVVDIAGRYLAQWQPHELAEIPAQCRPRCASDGEEIADAALALTKARIHCPGTQPRLEEMAGFFAMACRRISELEAIPHRLADKAYLTR